MLHLVVEAVGLPPPAGTARDLLTVAASAAPKTPHLAPEAAEVLPKLLIFRLKLIILLIKHLCAPEAALSRLPDL